MRGQKGYDSTYMEAFTVEYLLYFVIKYQGYALVEGEELTRKAIRVQARNGSKKTTLAAALKVRTYVTSC